MGGHIALLQARLFHGNPLLGRHGEQPPQPLGVFANIGHPVT
jgi:hypothetical protein